MKIRYFMLTGATILLSAEANAVSCSETQECRRITGLEINQAKLRKDAGLTTSGEADEEKEKINRGCLDTGPVTAKCKAAIEALKTKFPKIAVEITEAKAQGNAANVAQNATNAETKAASNKTPPLSLKASATAKAGNTEVQTARRTFSFPKVFSRKKETR